jgi:hypothetical protein
MRNGRMSFVENKGVGMEKITVPFKIDKKDVLFFIEDAIRMVHKQNGKYPGILTVSSQMDKRIRGCIRKRTGMDIIGDIPHMYGMKYEVDPTLPEGRAIVHD